LGLQYVLIEGRVYASGPERHQWAGAIGDIKRLESWPFDEDAGPRR